MYKRQGKEFVDGVLPTPEEICKKQLFKTMDDIMKTDVDEDQIEPYKMCIRDSIRSLRSLRLSHGISMSRSGKVLPPRSTSEMCIRDSPSRFSSTP